MAATAAKRIKVMTKSLLYHKTNKTLPPRPKTYGIRSLIFCGEISLRKTLSGGVSCRANNGGKANESKQTTAVNAPTI